MPRATSIAGSGIGEPRNRTAMTRRDDGRGTGASGPRHPERVAAVPRRLSAERRAPTLLIAQGLSDRGPPVFGFGGRRSDNSGAQARRPVFVEGIGGEGIDDAAKAVTDRQKRRIIAAAEGARRAPRTTLQPTIDFDAMLVEPGASAAHPAH